MNKNYGVKLLSVFLLLMIWSTFVAADDSEKMYSVTITNITKGISFTPLLVVSHKPGHPIFELGSPASEELVALAESGNTQPLLDKLVDMGIVYDSGSNGALLAPGESTTVDVKFTKKFNYVSVASMLLPTNDGFVALNGVKGPKHKKQTKSRMLPGFDAGSENNDELCANIPGPHCMGGALSPEDGEGYVYIHNGIQGVGDLMSADYDWRNPIAKVTIKRMK